MQLPRKKILGVEVLNIIQVVGGVLGIFGVIFTAFFFFEGRYAYAEKLDEVSNRLEIKINKDRSYILQSRIWVLEDRQRSGIDPIGQKFLSEQLRETKYEKEQVDETLDGLVKVTSKEE